MLLAAAVLSAFFLFGRASYGVEIELNPRRVVVGDRAMGRMVVTNTGGRNLPPTRMELPVGKGLAEFQLPAMKPKDEQEELFAVPTNRRAVIVAGPAESVRGDQLGLLRRALRWADPVELFVHPRTARIAASAAGLVRDLEGQVSKKITNNDIAFHALRPYVPGDDRRIRALAHLGAHRAAHGAAVRGDAALAAHHDPLDASGALRLGRRVRARDLGHGIHRGAGDHRRHADERRERRRRSGRRSA